MMDPILIPQRIVSHVKTRRLGYIRMIVDILHNFNSLTVDLLFTKMVDAARKEEIKLSEYVDQTGVINIHNENAAKNAILRYLELAKAMEYVTKIGKRWFVSGYGDVLASLPKNKENPFKLTRNEAFLFLKTILRKDYDYAKVMLENALLTKNKANEWSFFLEKVIERIKMKERRSNISLVREENQSVIRELMSWEKNPERYYLENIKAPRKNWFLDVGLIIGREIHVIAEKIKKFVKNELISEYWLWNEYPKIFANCYMQTIKTTLHIWSEINPSDKKDILLRRLDEAFKIFSHTGNGLIDALQFFEYAMNKIICEDAIICTLEELEESLLSYGMIADFPYTYRRIHVKSGPFIRSLGYIIKKS